MKNITNNNNVKDHLGDLQIAGYVDSLLTNTLADISESLRFHVQDCEACKKKILEVSIFLKKPGAREKDVIKLFEKHSSEGKRKIGIFPTAMIRRVAALFVFGIMSLGFYFFITDSGPFFKHAADTGKRTESNYLNKPDQTDLFPENTNTRKETIRLRSEDNAIHFKANSNLELMVNNKLRSFGPVVVSPQNNIELTLPIIFEFKGPLKNSLILKILNNRNEIIYEYTISDTRLKFAHTLTPGLYYWKLEDARDLLYVGKFYIKKPRL